jgi:tRNA nucleotidyltransferase (CCA-adding enzyme)
MSNRNIEKKVLEKITPTDEYRRKVKEVVKEIDEILITEIKKRNLPANVQLVGSIAKDTYLQNNMDIDFFLCFPTDVSKEKIAKHALEIGKSFLENTEESYAEHPYLRGYFENYLIEIVPCYKIEKADQKLSAVDRTPLHTKFVIENITPDGKQDVRLFKQFLKGISCYGAEAQIEGFSGYLCEILIINFGSFKKLLDESTEWKYGKKIALKKGDYPDFDTPLVFIDPVDNERNVASAVSKEKFEFFIKASKEYLKNPKITFFFPNRLKPWNLSRIENEIVKQKCRYIGVRIEKPEIIDENLYPQIRKSLRSIVDESKRKDFTIFDSTYYVDEKKIVFIFKTKKRYLSPTLEHMGPPIRKKENSEEFLKKWKDDYRVVEPPFQKNNRWYVKIKREYVDIKDFLTDQIKNLSMGKHIDKIVKKKYTIIEYKDLVKENLKTFWTEYLDGKMPWER